MAEKPSTSVGGSARFQEQCSTAHHDRGRSLLDCKILPLTPWLPGADWPWVKTKMAPQEDL